MHRVHLPKYRHSNIYFEPLNAKSTFGLKKVHAQSTVHAFHFWVY